MSRQRRNFSAKFKSDLVIELLKGEKDLNTLAVENNIQPNLLRNWKKEFLDNASVVFDDTLDTRMVINALKKAFKVTKPQILNSDQGCQFTSRQYIDFVKENGIRQSMDGKSRWADNIIIERWFRSFKYEEAYLTQYSNIKEARAAMSMLFLPFWNVKII